MTFRIRIAAAAFGLACLAATPLHAQNAPAADDSLFRALGGESALVALMDDFMVRLHADPRMQPFFKDVDDADLKRKLVLQFCEVSGGPCKAKNPDMKETHADMHIRAGDFNALVEVLQLSMDAKGIAFATQNRLLARLAPMHRDVINTR